MMARQEPARAALADAVAELNRETAPRQTPAVARLQAISGVVPTGDRSLDQVRAQLAAFGCDAYEVQPIPPKGVEGLRRERIRKWTAEQVEKAVGWLKRMNAMGYDIFIRPAAPTEKTAQPFVFVDDIDQRTVDRMGKDGYPFAVLNESSPGRFHGWVRIAAAPLDREEVSRAGRLLAEAYGADPNSADWRHYGRVAGTTNRKPSRATPRGAPFVMLRSASGTQAPAGAELLAQARQSLDHDAKAATRAAQEAQRAVAFQGNRKGLQDAASAFQAARAAARPARPDDESARDFSASLSLLRRGYSTDQVEAAIRQARPDLETKHANPNDYVQRTVANAAARIQASQGLSGPRMG